jgi:sugar phosphate permease
VTSFRWKIIGLAFFATIVNYLDRSALAYAITPLQQTFGLTNLDFGMLASAFGAGYLVMTVGGGVLVDRYGARKIWSIFAVFWSLACAGIGLAAGFTSILIMRALLGVAEGPGFPAMTRVVADWLPIEERSRALAIGLAAVPFASVIGAPLISHLILVAGWRVMFIVLGALGVVWALIWHALYRDKPAESKHVSPEELQLINASIAQNRQKPSSWRYILGSRTLLTNNYAFFAFGYLLFFAITWLPGYLEQVHHMKVREIGWFLMMPWLTATILILAGGVASDWLWKRTRSIRVSRSHIIWVGQLLSALAFLPILFSDSVIVAAISISLGIGFGMMPNAAFYALNADLAHDKAATSLGVMDAAFAIAGIIAPLLTGWLSNTTGNFSIAIGLMAALTMSSAMLILFFQHPDEEAAARRQQA